MSDDYIITNYNKHRAYQRMVQDEKGQYKLVNRGKKTKAQKRLDKQRRKLNRKDKFPKASPVKNPTRNYYLYALELEDGLYYVGLTAYKGAVQRYSQHIAGKGSKWTKLHKPIRMIEVRDIGVCRQTTAIEAENLMTREYMRKYGMYKVRGGDLCYVKDTMVALHYNDNGVKTILYDANGKKISRSHKALRRRETQEQEIQEQIARDLAWIFH